MRKRFGRGYGVLDNAFMPRRKNWIGAAISGALSLGSAIFGGAQSAAANEAARREREASYNRQRASLMADEVPYAQTAQGMSLLEQARSYGDAQWKKAQGAAAVGGGTDASVALAKEGANNVMSSTLNNMATQDGLRQERIHAQQRQLDNQQSAEMAELERQRGNNLAQVASAAGNAIGGMVGAIPDSQSPSLNSNIDTQSTQRKVQEALINRQAGDAIDKMNKKINMPNPYA